MFDLPANGAFGETAFEPVRIAEVLPRLQQLMSFRDLTSEHRERRITGVVLCEPDMQVDYTDKLVIEVAGVPISEDLAAKLTSASVLLLSPGSAAASWFDTAGPAQEGPVIAFRTPWVSRGELLMQLHDLFAAQYHSRQVQAQVQIKSLQQLAEWVADTTGTLVTIEDLDSQVLAFSAHNEQVDKLRSATILSRRVPRERVAELLRNGFLPAVWNSSGVVERAADGKDPERFVISVRVRGSAIATIWAALPQQGCDRDALRYTLKTAAKIAAPLLLDERREKQLADQIATHAFSQLLRGEGEVTPQEAGLVATESYRVLAVDCSEAQLRDKLAFYLQAKFPAGQGIVEGGCVLFAAPCRGDVGEWSDKLLAFLRRAVGSSEFVLAVGVPVSARQLVDSARSARRELLVRRLRYELGAGDGHLVLEPAADGVLIADVPSALASLVGVVLELRPKLAGLLLPVEQLHGIDASRGSRFFESLLAVLRADWNMAAAARELGIHANSLRGRVEKAEQLLSMPLSGGADRVGFEALLFVSTVCRIADELFG